MSSTLSRFQDRLVHALFADGASDAPELAGLLAQPGFAVYRNTVIGGCVDALQANYPAVSRLVGSDWFRAAATEYARRHPPRDPCLLAYGEAFPRFLERFPPAQALPYLPGVANLDRFWSEAHAGHDQATLTPAALAGMPLQALGQLALHPHACARWAWFEHAPVTTIWQRNRTRQEEAAELDWHGQGVLLLRPRDAVTSQPIGQGTCAFLDACQAGRPLAEAAECALAAEPGQDLARLFARLLEDGAFAPLDATPPTGAP